MRSLEIRGVLDKVSGFSTIIRICVGAYSTQWTRTRSRGYFALEMRCFMLVIYSPRGVDNRMPAFEGGASKMCLPLPDSLGGNQLPKFAYQFAPPVGV